MKTFYQVLSLLLAFIQPLSAQNNTQVIKGMISDKHALTPIPGASIQILNTNPLLGTLSKENGQYELKNVPPGRYTLKVSYTGYKEQMIPSVVVTSGKEVIVDINMEESVKSLKAAVVKGSSKSKTINELSTVSARTFSMEEVNRYAGGRSDPARLAANFAGVSAPDDSRNDIVIRGNSPTGVLWRIEGMNIPNPNHFSTIGTTGGPVSALNTNVLKNSDFFTSAFPAEYGNANAGVFDLGFRKGNAGKREHTLQFGMLTGLEGMTEGPIGKQGASYLVAYRYAFTGVAQAMGLSIGTTATPFYQDLSFKIQGADTRWGRFTLFGIGGTSKISFLHTKLDQSDLFADPTRDSYFRSDVGLTGLKHFIRLNKKSYLQSLIGVTYAGSSYLEDSISTDGGRPDRIIENKTARLNYNLATTFHSKINSRLFIKSGIQTEIMNLNLTWQTRQFTSTWLQVWDSKDHTALSQAFFHAKYTLSQAMTINAGVRAQVLSLNQSWAVEPRIGLRYQAGEKSTFTLGYGIHNQMQPIDVYFLRTLNPDGSYSQTNRDLKFTGSHHAVLGYEWQPHKDWRVKTEVYYQYLYRVPVTRFASSYSMLNAGASFLPNEQPFLVNQGSGENKGAELTIEKFFSRGYYGLITGSIYESTYKGSDEITRNTAFNGRYVYNVLLGKEIKFGKDKRHAITADIKLTQAGGRFYTPVDLDASRAARDQVLMGDEFAFTRRNPDFFRLDIKTGLVFNSKKRQLTHSLFFDIQNVTDNKNVFAERYNPVTQTINTAYQIGLFPNMVYKLQF